MSSWTELLEKTTIGSLISNKKPLITLSLTSTIRQSLQVLSENNILSAPVVTQEGGIIGFVDVLDICGYVLQYWSQHVPKWNSKHFPSADFFNTHIGNVLNFSHVDTPFVVTASTSLKTVVDGLKLHKHHRVHRIAVENNGVIVNVFSQSDIVTFLHANIALFPYADVEVSHLKIKRHPILVRLDTPMIDALRLLYDNRVSGIALVDENYHLDGNFSASDIRGILPFAFEVFDRSVLHYLSRGTKTSPHIGLISCQEQAPLRVVVGMMVNEHVHRVWVVDEGNHTVGVITMTDIISLM